MQFRFEGRKNDDGINFDEYPNSLSIIHEFDMDDATQWGNVMIQFAKFLDACGYVGVYDKVYKRNEQEWDFLTALDEDENTSNPGLSD